MGQSYEQLSLEERCEIARRREAGEAIRQIAAAMDRSPSSITRELRRNAGAGGRYRPAYAGEQAMARRWRGSRMERDAVLQQRVLESLKLGGAPEPVAEAVSREPGK